MIVEARQPIVLREYTETALPTATFTEEVGQFIWHHYRDYVDIDFPSPKTGGSWRLRAKGVVGYLPLGHEYGISILPKVPLRNLFGMLEYAYAVNIRLFDQNFTSDAFKDFYSRIAKILALRILDRGRRGLYRSYIGQQEQLAYVTGQLNVTRMLTRPWDLTFQCDYHEHTADIEDNQILGWTLHQIMLSGLCSSDVLPTVREAYRGFHGTVTERRFTAAVCSGRVYNRLNEDYRTLHGLCRFFLEHSGPSYQLGDRTMIPFIVDMAQVYEVFVQQWLASNLPAAYGLEAQKIHHLNRADDLSFRIDLVIYDQTDNKPVMVLDTKYKAASKPRPDDLQQIIAYAQVMGCRHAALVYPIPLERPQNIVSHDIHVKTLTFAVDDDLETRGREFLDQLLARLDES